MTGPALTPEVLEELAKLNAAYWNEIRQSLNGGNQMAMGRTRSNLVDAVVPQLPALLAAAQRAQNLEQFLADAVPFQDWAQSYLRGKRAGHRLDDAIKAELLERDEERDRLRARVAELEADKALLQGVIRADEHRLTEAAVKVWGENVHGCDAPEWLADEILGLREDVAELRAHRAELAAIDDALGPLTEATRQAQVRLLVERLGQSQVRDYQWIGFARSVGLAVNCLYSSFPEGNGHIVAKATQLASLAARQAEKETTT